MHYAPYSDLLVLAAVQSSTGEVFGGANVEISNFSLSKHAEEAAILAALAARTGPPTGWLRVLYVAGAVPCGGCRQFAHEFAAEGTICVIDDIGQSALRDGALTDSGGSAPEIWYLDELLPRAFGAEDVPERRDGGG